MREYSIVIVLSLASAALLCADTLILTNGAKLEGAFLGGTTREIQFQGQDGNVKSYAISSIVALQFAPAGPAAGRPAAAPPAAASPAVSPLPAGTPMTVRMVDSIDSKATAIGERFRASVDDPVVVGDQVVIPRGVDASVQVMEVEGQKELAIKLYDITLNGRTYDTVASYARLQASGSSRGAKAAGRGVVLSGIGAASGKHLVVPSETRLVFELRARCRWGDAGLHPENAHVPKEREKQWTTE